MMGLQNIEFDMNSAAQTHCQQNHCEPLNLGTDCDLDERFCYWKGASGSGYIHTVYSLLDTPELPEANYVLVLRDEDGRRTPLRIGRTEHEAGSLNLAEIRHRAARLGANEVHVHLISDTKRDRALAECDLRAGLFHSLSSERSYTKSVFGLN